MTQLRPHQTLTPNSTGNLWGQPGQRKSAEPKPLNRFKGRYVVVTETSHIASKPTYKYLSFRSRAAANDSLDRKIKSIGLSGDITKRAYLVDTVLQPYVILP